MAVDVEFLREAAERTLQLEQVRQAEISVAVIDHAEMRALNRQYLDHDYETDVLSFLLDSENDERAGGVRRLSGEVIISAEMARERAGEFGWRPQSELVFYLVHGVLHLCGYDDATAEDRAEMYDRERAVMETWGMTPQGREMPGKNTA